MKYFGLAYERKCLSSLLYFGMQRTSIARALLINSLNRVCAKLHNVLHTVEDVEPSGPSPIDIELSARRIYDTEEWRKGLAQRISADSGYQLRSDLCTLPLYRCSDVGVRIKLGK